MKLTMKIHHDSRRAAVYLEGSQTSSPRSPSLLEKEPLHSRHCCGRTSHNMPPWLVYQIAIASVDQVLVHQLLNRSWCLVTCFQPSPVGKPTLSRKTPGPRFSVARTDYQRQDNLQSVCVILDSGDGPSKSMVLASAWDLWELLWSIVA